MEILNNHIVVKPIAPTTVFNKGQKKAFYDVQNRFSRNVNCAWFF
jgi:hypothetical protein